MADTPKLFIYEEQIITVGQDIFIDSTAENNNCVVFEDDTDTGYFYAIDRNNDQAVLDGLHIYDVANVINKNRPLTLKILWTNDYSKCFLSLNDYYHAVFDFEGKAGYCRNAFPENKGHWAKTKDRKLTDELVISLLQAK